MATDAQLPEPEKEELYDGLVRLCQSAGFTTEHTYDLLHQVVNSITLDSEEDPLIDPEEDDDDGPQ